MHGSISLTTHAPSAPHVAPSIVSVSWLHIWPQPAVSHSSLTAIGPGFVPGWHGWFSRTQDALLQATSGTPGKSHTGTVVFVVVVVAVDVAVVVVAVVVVASVVGQPVVGPPVVAAAVVGSAPLDADDGPLPVVLGPPVVLLL